MTDNLLTQVDALCDALSISEYDPANAWDRITKLGTARLNGQQLPEHEEAHDSPLPRVLIGRAMNHNLAVLARATQDAKKLPARFEAAEPLDELSLCVSLLYEAMSQWAFRVVIDREYAAYEREDKPGRGVFRIWMIKQNAAYKEFNDELQQEAQLELLSLVTELPLLDYWRRQLVAPYDNCRPWWLGGRLEAVARRLQEKVCNVESLEEQFQIGEDNEANRSLGLELWRQEALRASKAASIDEQIEKDAGRLLVDRKPYRDKSRDERNDQRDRRSERNGR